MPVIGLGAWCDYVSEGEYRERLAQGSLSPRQVAEAVDHFRRGFSFVVHEFADLSDGRRLILHTDRGFTSQPSVASVDPWELLTSEHVERSVRTTVLPDDDTGDDHPWPWLVELLRSLGVAATPEQLEHAPYGIEFSQRLRDRLRPR